MLKATSDILEFLCTIVYVLLAMLICADNQFTICTNHNVWIVSGNYYLPKLLLLSEILHQIIINRSVIEIIFRLVYQDRTVLIIEIQ